MRAIQEKVHELRRIVDQASSEGVVQRFLERHPELFLDLLPGRKAWVVSQFPLGADFRCDFAFVHTNSGGNFLEMIEFENPRERIFNRNDSYSAASNHALQQMLDWYSWCQSHQDTLRPLLRQLLRHLKSDHFYPHTTLVMGRRSELSTPRRRLRYEARIQSLPRGVSIRTYDGFIERLEASERWEGYQIRCARYRGQSFVPIQAEDELVT